MTEGYCPTLALLNLGGGQDFNQARSNKTEQLTEKQIDVKKRAGLVVTITQLL